MTTRHRGLTVAAAFLVLLAVDARIAIAQAATATEINSSFVGTWDGKRNDGTAGLELEFQEDDGKLSGSALLYFRSAVPCLF